MLKAGDRLACPECPAEIVVTRAQEAEASLGCSSSPLVALDAPRPLEGHGALEPGEEPALLGKRYEDQTAGVELLCTKAGKGALSCDGRAMTLRSAKPLPSSD